MSPLIKGIIAVILGCIVGVVVNMGLIILSPHIIPLPEGVDPTNPENLKAGMHLFEFKHFIVPFLAHALGTLAGAFTTASLAPSSSMKYAMGIAVFFLLGGIANVMNLGAPMWFNALDLIVAYFPMGWLGGVLAASRSSID